MSHLPVPQDIVDAPEPGVYPGLGVLSVEEWVVTYIETGQAEADWKEKCAKQREWLLEYEILYASEGDVT